MMRNLPVPVEEEEIEAMFEFADKDKDGKINYRRGQQSFLNSFFSHFKVGGHFLDSSEFFQGYQVKKSPKKAKRKT